MTNNSIKTLYNTSQKTHLLYGVTKRGYEGLSENLQSICPSKRKFGGRGIEFRQGQPCSDVTPSLLPVRKRGHHDKNKSTESRKIKPRPSLQYLSKKLEHAIPYGINIPNKSTDMPRLPRSKNKLLPIRSEQNKRGDTTCRASRSNIQSEITRCQTAEYSNKTTHKNSAVKFTENTKIQNASIAMSSRALSAKNGLHNRYSVNLQKFPTKNNTIGLTVAFSGTHTNGRDVMGHNPEVTRGTPHKRSQPSIQRSMR